MLVEPPDLSVRPSAGARIFANPLATDRFAYERACRIILIHGFRTSEADALKSYDNFKTYFSRFSSLYSEKIFSFVWPGDHLGTNILKYFDDNVQSSLEAGRVLGMYLERLASQHTPDCQFIIVAHSLGCRLTAAMLREVHNRNAAVCKRFKIILMAGAVPCHDVADPVTFGAPIEATSYAANLYSSADFVLKRLFGLGEIGGGRGISEPIGLHGGPKSFGWTECKEMEGFGHLDYWGRSSAPEFLARLLGANIDNNIPKNDIAANVPTSHDIDLQ